MLFLYGFIKNHWRPLAVVMALLVAFGAGFGSAWKMAKPLVSVSVLTQTVEKRVEVQSKAVEKRVVVYRDRVIKPDGTQVIHEVEKSQTDVKSTKTVTDAKETATASTHTETQQALPNWRVGVLVGVNWEGVHLAPLSIGIDALTYGVSVDRRILGPFSAGLWVVNNGAKFSPALGLQLSMEF